MTLNVTSTSHATGINKRYSGIDSSKYLGKVEKITRVTDRKVFLEGPAVNRAGEVLFTNVPMEKILKWSPSEKKLTVFREKSNKANGLLFDPQGRLLACEGGAGRVTRTNLKTGKIAVLADKFNGFPLAAPNDLELTASGKLFFTSRPGTTDPRKGNPNAVYRLDLRKGTIHHEAGTGKKGFTGNGGPAKAATLSGPKGIAVGPRGNIYLADTESHSVRMIDRQTGRLELIAGDGKKGDGPEGDPLKCRMDRLHGIFVDSKGVIYVGDTNTHRVRAIRP